MSTIFNAFALSASGMEAQSRRLQHVAENVANADTPGYRRKTIEFNVAPVRAGTVALVETGPVRLDPRALERVFAPGHALADADGYVDGSNVDLSIEMADAREAGRSYEANLRMFDQSRQMSQSVLELLRK